MYYAKINEYASRKNADLFDNKYNGPTFYDMMAKTKTYEFLLLTKLSYLLCRAGIVKCKRSGSCYNRFTFSDAITKIERTVSLLAKFCIHCTRGRQIGR